MPWWGWLIVSVWALLGFSGWYVAFKNDLQASDFGILILAILTGPFAWTAV